MPKWEAPGTFHFARLAKAAESRSRKEVKRSLKERWEQEVNKTKATLMRRLRTLTKQKVNVKTLVKRGKRQMKTFNVGQSVKTDLGIGKITRIRPDSNGRDIYDIHLNSYNLVEDGMIVAREEELLYHEVKDK